MSVDTIGYFIILMKSFSQILNGIKWDFWKLHMGIHKHNAIPSLGVSGDTKTFCERTFDILMFLPEATEFYATKKNISVEVCRNSFLSEVIKASKDYIDALNEENSAVSNKNSVLSDRLRNTSNILGLGGMFTNAYLF